GVHRCVHVHHPPAGLRHLLHGRAQQDAAVGPCVTRVGVREVTPYVAQGRRAQYRIGDRVQQHVGVGMPLQTVGVRNTHATDDEVTAFDQRMYIETLADTRSEERR